MKKNIVIFVFGFLIIGSLIGLYKYISFTNNYVSSDAVFVKSDSFTNLSFKLPGKIDKIYVSEGDEIKKGSLLAKLDTSSLDIQKKELIFSIKALKNNIKSLVIQKQKLLNDINYNLSLLENEEKKLQKNINAFEFSIKALQVRLNKAKIDYQRFKKLYIQNKISKEKFETFKSNYFVLDNELKSNQQKLQALKLEKNNLKIKKLLTLNNQKEAKKLQKIILANKDKLKSLKQKLALIKQKIKDSFIYAPFDGVVAKKFVNNDEVISSAKVVLSVVNLNDIYVLDLLEESKLKNITKNCSVKIHIDAFDKDYKGYVEKILPASAATFALIPRDISSGEFTKLQQRFYVRIRFNNIPKDIKVGMSGEVMIQKCLDIDK